MKTKDFIAMLQKEDPTGEGYIRLPGGGAPYFAEAKEGYWDGPYQYLEYRKDKHGHDAVLVTSTQGYKVDIFVKDTTDIVWAEKGDMTKIKERIKHDLTYFRNDEREAEYWKYIEQEASYARDFNERSLKEWTQRVLEKFYEGDVFEVRQPLTNPIGHYNCMAAFENGWWWFAKEKKIHLCQGECGAIIESGLFYPEKTDKYYIWKYDPQKGKDWTIKD